MPLALSPPLVFTGTLARQARAACQRVRTAFAFLHEAQIFGRDDLGDGETIVHFGELDIAAP